MKSPLLRPVMNLTLKANETPPTHNNRSRGAGGVWDKITRGFADVLYSTPNRVWCITRDSLNIVRGKNEIPAIRNHCTVGLRKLHRH